MVPGSIALPLAALILAAYLGYRRISPRLRRVQSGPPTIELRDEPPAVVNLLVNQLVDAPQAASATLLDLAARRILEIYQVADEPGQTLVRVATAPLPADAPAFERRVYERVERLAGSRLTPVTALIAAHSPGGYHWQRHLVREVVLAARRRGLVGYVEAGCGLPVLTAALASGVALAALLPHGDSHGNSHGNSHGGLALLLGVWLLATLIGGFLLAYVSFSGSNVRPDRYTPAGRAATAHWLGVADWLRGHEPLRDLPPAAVAIWDRYLAYAAALNTSPHAVRVLDFETVGRSDVLFSTHTGARRPVRVRYWQRRPWLRLFGRASARASLIWGLLSLPIWAAAGWVVDAELSHGYLWGLLLALVAVQLLRAGYRIVRAALDLAHPVQVTGTVLDVTVGSLQRSADHSRPGFDLPDLPTHYYLVVDDGSTDELRPWLVNRDLARGRQMEPMPVHANPVRFAAWHEALVRPFFQPGDRIRLTGQPWSRFVIALKPASADPRAGKRD